MTHRFILISIINLFTWWSLNDPFRNILEYLKKLEIIGITGLLKKKVICRERARAMNLVLSDFNSFVAVLLTRYLARSRNIGLQLQPKFVRGRRRHYHHPRVSADYDSSTRERRERERAGERAADEASRSMQRRQRPRRPTIPTRSVATLESGKAHAAQSVGAQSAVHFRYIRAESRHALRPSRGPSCASWRPSPSAPCRTLAGVRNTHVRSLNFARLSWPDERGRGRDRGEACISENRRHPVQSARLATRCLEFRVSIF